MALFVIFFLPNVADTALHVHHWYLAWLLALLARFNTPWSVATQVCPPHPPPPSLPFVAHVRSWHQVCALRRPAAPLDVLKGARSGAAAARRPKGSAHGRGASPRAQRRLGRRLGHEKVGCSGRAKSKETQFIFRLFGNHLGSCARGQFFRNVSFLL